MPMHSRLICSPLQVRRHCAERSSKAGVGLRAGRCASSCLAVANRGDPAVRTSRLSVWIACASGLLLPTCGMQQCWSAFTETDPPRRPLTGASPMATSHSKACSCRSEDMARRNGEADAVSAELQQTKRKLDDAHAVRTNSAITCHLAHQTPEHSDFCTSAQSERTAVHRISEVGGDDWPGLCRAGMRAQCRQPHQRRSFCSCGRGWQTQRRCAIHSQYRQCSLVKAAIQDSDCRCMCPWPATAWHSHADQCKSHAADFEAVRHTGQSQVQLYENMHSGQLYAVCRSAARQTSYRARAAA